MEKIFCRIFAIMLALVAFAQYPHQLYAQTEDMLTPEYYDSAEGSDFKNEVDNFIYFARQLPFQNPFEDSLGNVLTYNIKRGFGEGIGPGGTGSHHPAFDFHPGQSEVNMYAAHDGIVAVGREVDRYRHYLSITKEIVDSVDNYLGKMVTYYAHIDLDLDSIAGLSLKGQTIKKGDLVSKNLFSGTVGGPHLHFEIRYYRNTDSGLEDFYGRNIGENTSPSSGPWTYGYWNPNHGYGFAHPLNHFGEDTLNLVSNHIEEGMKIFPNPAQDFFSITSEKGDIQQMSIFDMNGTAVLTLNKPLLIDKRIDISYLKSGVYWILCIDNQAKVRASKLIINRK